MYIHIYNCWALFSTFMREILWTAIFSLFIAFIFEYNSSCGLHFEYRHCICGSEGCSLHVVALLDSIWIDKLHRLSLPTGKWAQLPFFGPASHWNPQSGWHYSYSKRETLRATQAPKLVNSPPPPLPLRQQHSIQQHTSMQPHHTLIKNS